MLGVSRPFLTRMVDEGRIPHHLTGRDRRIAAADVVAILEQREELKRRQTEDAATYSVRRSERLAATAGVSANEAAELGFG
jgi:excisionase family DNA binding protein